LQAYQHIYLGLLYGLLAIKSILLDDFQSISAGSIGPVSISKLTREEKAIFWGGKLLWLAYFIMLPAVRSHHSFAALAALWLLSEAVTGWILALMFQVSSQHSPDQVVFLILDAIITMGDPGFVAVSAVGMSCDKAIC